MHVIVDDCPTGGDASVDASVPQRLARPSGSGGVGQRCVLEECGIMRGQMLCWGLTILLLATPLCAQDGLQLREQGKKLFFEHGCFGCHTVGTVGTMIGPDLSDVGAKYPPSFLLQWLRDPSSQKPKAHMPKLVLSEDDIRALGAYLSSLR
jgi:mono/diheme cytochrome c family protein